MAEGFRLPTERLELRDFREDDFADVQTYAVDPEVYRFMPWGPNSPDDTRGFLRMAMTGADHDPRNSYELAIEEREGGRLLSGVGIDRSGTNAMVGYCLRRDAWGRGIATEAAWALIDFAFSELGVHRVWAGCDPENEASIRVLEKLGMRREGWLREETLIRGEYRDTLVFAVLVDEWRDPPSRTRE